VLGTEKNTWFWAFSPEPLLAANIFSCQPFRSIGEQL